MYQSIEKYYDSHPYCVALRFTSVIRISKITLRPGNEAKTKILSKTRKLFRDL